jgi:alkaline phosphatase D
MQKLAVLPLVVLLSIQLFAQGSIDLANHSNYSLFENLYRSPVDFQRKVTTLAFGSCNDQERDQNMWKAIVENQPDVWVWLGDNVYCDTEDMQFLASKYAKVKTEQGYQHLREMASVIGTWDDHDYGQNDGGKDYAFKKQSRDLMLDFLDVPLNNPAWAREGAYQTYSIGPAGQKIKFLLLDARYFRDELVANPDKNPRYFVNKDGDMLGEAQWNWLGNELLNSDAQVHIIACGIQFVNIEQGFEKWGNFPKARQRLFDLLGRVKPAQTLLLSGDRHIAEVSQTQVPGLPYPLYDCTSSGLTHAYNGVNTEGNQYRKGQLISERNFGLLRFNWATPKPAISFEVRGLENKLLMQLDLFPPTQTLSK